MKWPIELTLVRHGLSKYNELKKKKEKSELYRRFKAEYERDFESRECRALAQMVEGEFALGLGDYETPLTPEGDWQALATGRELRSSIEKPDIVFVSPYLRTRQTFGHLAETWPSLKGARVFFDDRIREQEHGLALLYNDWRVFNVMHPEQKRLRDLQGPYWYQFPQGESVSHVRDRARSVASTLVRECAGLRVMLITHHLTILSFRANFERLTPEQFVQLDDFEKPVNCGVTVYRGNPGVGKNGKLELKLYNRKLY